MKNTAILNQAKQNEKETGISPITAAITGAIIGAGIAIAGTVALENKKNRNKVKQVFINMRDQAVDYMEKMQKKAKSKKNDFDKSLLIEKIE